MPMHIPSVPQSPVFLLYFFLRLAPFAKSIASETPTVSHGRAARVKSRILFIAVPPITVYVFEKQKIYQHGGYDEVMKPHTFKQNEA